MSKTSSPQWLRPNTRVERAQQDAQEHARQGGYELVRSEHLLLALAQEPRSLSALMLERLGVSMQAIRAEIPRMKANQETRADLGAPAGRHDWPWSQAERGRSSAQQSPVQPTQEAWAANRSQLLDAGRQEAQALGDKYVGTEHLLLALLRADDTGGAALRSLGVTWERARATLLILRGDHL